jgi:hypothetical protein
MWVFLASSVFVKTPQRIAALSLVMVLCLLVYRLAEHRLRERLAGTEQTIPSQMKQPTDRSTMRWVFQCFEGSTCSTYDMDPRLRGPWCFVWNPSTSRCSRSSDRPTKKSTNRPSDRAESELMHTLAVLLNVDLGNPPLHLAQLVA